MNAAGPHDLLGRRYRSLGWRIQDGLEDGRAYVVVLGFVDLPAIYSAHVTVAGSCTTTRCDFRPSIDTTRAMEHAQRGLAGDFEDDPSLDREGYREIVELLRKLDIT